MGGRSAKSSLAVVLCTAVAVLAPGAASAQASCDLVAAPGGSDSAAGTLAAPLASVQQLVGSLAAGQTGCLRAGAYGSAAQQVKISTPGVTLTSYPGERATVRGRLWVAQEAPGTTVADLDLDGRNPTDLPSPTINADDVVLSGNDITNHHTTICVSLGTATTWGRAERTLIENNRIHDCGRLPATNQDHGIYVNSADDTVIRNNWIYDNADRGIQLYPDAQRTLVTGNVIDGNGSGVIISGANGTASSHNVVEHNVIANSRVRHNVESWWPDGNPVGTDNVVRDNCIFGASSSYAQSDGSGIQAPHVGFSLVSNLVADPLYVDRDAKDFTLRADSPCGQILAGAQGPPELTIAANRGRARVGGRIRLQGSSASAAKVRVKALIKGRWRTVASDASVADGSFEVRVRLRPKLEGRREFKATAAGLPDSGTARVRVRN